MSLGHRRKRLRANSQNLRGKNLPGFNGSRVLATRRFLRTVLQPFNAARPIDIMAAIMSFSLVRSRPISTIDRSRCCLLVAGFARVFAPPARWGVFWCGVGDFLTALSDQFAGLLPLLQ